MSFDDDMRNRFANQTPTISDLDAGAAAAANSAKRRTAAFRGLAAVALVAIVGVGALALASDGTDLTNVATDNAELDEPIDDGEGGETGDDGTGSDDDGVSEETSERAEELLEAEEELIENAGESADDESTPTSIDPEDGEDLEDDEVVDEPVSTLGSDTVFQVTGVASDDVLNARAGAGTDFDVTDVFAFDATGIVRTDADSVFIGSSEWIEVYGSVSGSRAWVNSFFLAPMEVIEDQPCVFDTGLAPPTTTFQNVDGSEDSEAAVVSSVDTFRFGSCIRTVIELADGWSFDGGGNPVTVLPNDITVGPSSEIDFGVSISSAEAAEARYVEAELRHSVFLTVQELNRVTGVLYGPSEFLDVTFDNNNGRIIIDTADMGEANTNAQPLIDDNGVVVTEVTVDGDVVTLAGFARPFEANLGVQVESAGTPIDVNWTNGVVPGLVSSSNGVMTTTWTEGWGYFEFGIEPVDDIDLADVVVRLDPSGGAADDPETLDVAVAFWVE